MPHQEVRIGFKDTGIEAAIKNAVLEDDEMIQALIQSHKIDDPRAVITDDSFVITSVDYGENGEVSISYSFEWSSHYGCKDMCDSDTEYGFSTGRLVNGELVFNIKILEDRTTFEEF